MPYLRQDPIVGRWVIVAKNRARRPQDFQQGVASRKATECPFCEGNERDTPDEIMAYRPNGSAANGPGWQIRVVPNKYPALELNGDLESRGEGLYELMRGVGAHEVIIECPRHLLSTADLSEQELAEVFWVYRQRLVDLQRDPRLVYGMLFKNVGPGAGASLEHAHSQLIATPVVPISVAEEMSGSGKYFDERGRCIFCDILRQELDDGRRLVTESPQFAVFCPFASRFPYETWVVPKEHGSHYEQLSRSTAEELAAVMRQVLGRLESALDRPAYNYIIHTAPFDTQRLRHYHWHIEIMPRLTNVAGFEWGTGFYINPVPPEEAAAFLRTAEVLSSRPSTPLTDSPLTEKSTTAQATKVAQQGKDAVETEAT